MKIAPDIIAQHTGKAQYQDKGTVDEDCFFSVPAEVVDAAGQQVLKYGDDRREAGEGHEQEEQGSPYPSAGHIGKHVGQGDEDQLRTGIRLYAEGEAGREDNQTLSRKRVSDFRE